MTLDLAHLDYGQLTELRARIDERMQQMRESGVPQLRARFCEEAAALGLSVEDILGNGKRSRRPKCRTPELGEG